MKYHFILNTVWSLANSGKNRQFVQFGRCKKLSIHFTLYRKTASKIPRNRLCEIFVLHHKDKDEHNIHSHEAVKHDITPVTPPSSDPHLLRNKIYELLSLINTLHCYPCIAQLPAKTWNTHKNLQIFFFFTNLSGLSKTHTSLNISNIVNFLNFNYDLTK